MTSDLGGSVAVNEPCLIEMAACAATSSQAGSQGWNVDHSVSQTGPEKR